MARMTLAAWRVNKKLSQKEAAKLLGVSNTTLCKWENGVSFPNQPCIEKLCKLYDCTYDMIEFVV